MENNNDLILYLDYLKYNRNYSENTIVNYKKAIEFLTKAEYLYFLKK